MVKQISKQRSGKVQQAPQSSTATSGNNTIYSYNHHIPRGPFAPGAIPKPIMIIGGLMLFASLYSFFVASTQSSGWSSFMSVIVGLIDILLVIGLLLRLEIARKIIIYASAAIIILTGLSGAAAYRSINTLEASKQRANEAIVEVRQQPLSTAQEAKLQELETVVIDTNRQVLLLQKRMTNLYIYWGFTALLHAGVAVYLTRPNVKKGFRKLR